MVYYHMSTDNELLGRYADQADEAAFAELVRRHVDFTYSAAVRVLGGNTHLAQDVMQQVFTDLARRARLLSRHPALPGWLHTHVRYTALDALRRERRRQAREHAAVAMQKPPDSPEPDWERMRPVLDEAVCHLNARDRNAVLLRFFKGESHRDIGVALGLSEEAARKRVDRALEKLRAHFARRGVPVSSTLLAATLSTHAIESAPVGMAAAVSGSALAGAAAATGWLGALLAPFLLMTTATKTALTLAIVFAVALPAYYHFQPATPPLRTAAAGENLPPRVAPATAPEVAPAPTAQADITPSAPAATATVPPPTIRFIAQPQPMLENAVSTAIHFLEAGDMDGVIKTVMPPSALEELVRNGQATSIDDAANHFAQMPDLRDKMTQLLQALKTTQGQLPVMSPDGLQAVYDVPVPRDTSGGRPIENPTKTTFVNINGFWYLK